MIQLLSDNFVVDLLKIMQEMGINPKNTGIEITESVFASDYTEINQIFQILRDIGIHIAIDDFGTGYSNFENILKLNVDYIKIDGYLIQGITENPRHHIVVETIVNFAHKIGAKTIAEFVSCEAIYNVVKELGIDYSQGYYSGRPQEIASSI